MAGELPEFYYRIRENGAAVFRVNTENRLRRIELDQIATANVRNGDIRAQGGHELTTAETAEISRWIAERQALLARRDLDDILRTVDHLNLTAQWAQSKASTVELETVTDTLLLAMHDLRTVLVRKKAEALGIDQSGD
ncbi:hypothetical protein FGG78_35220 [Thioclava sp. BHET1]|nr:hypothetical protein FGG78_35220 [Thioclava sp. BHET1]